MRRAALTLGLPLALIVFGWMVVNALAPLKGRPDLADFELADHFMKVVVDETAEDVGKSADKSQGATVAFAPEARLGRKVERAGTERSALEAYDALRIDQVAEPGGREGRQPSAAQVKDFGIHKALGSDLLGRGPLKNAFADQAGFDSKLNAAMSGVGGELVVGQGAGGMGQLGSGAGGGGQGFGRIHGLGRIDTGGGRGVDAKLGGKKAKRRQVRIHRGSAGISGACAPSDIRRVVRARQRGLQYCYEKALAGEPSLSGKVVLAWRLGATGKVTRVFVESSSLQSKAATGCMLRQVKRWRFPKPSGGECQIKYPFTFSASDGSPAVARREALTAPLQLRGPTQPGKPAAFLPRMAYFENTYLGRDAAYLEEQRQLNVALPAQPWAQAELPRQPFDAPGGAGLSLTATLSAKGIDGPQRVYLQVGLKGSERFGWRRPPLDLVLVVDQAARDLGGPAVAQLAARLSPVDRLAVVEAGARPRVLRPLTPVRHGRRALEALLDLGRQARSNGDLPAALAQAGALLRAVEAGARVPGTGTVLLLTRGGDAPLVARTARVAHQLTLGGAVTSVVAPDDQAPWWQVAKAGHGNDHRDRTVTEAVAAELDALSRVIARLLRLNIKLGPDAQAVRILGSRLLTQREKVQLKAREEATDLQISKSMGVTADRGADDDGLQTVIPFFYGGDAHVVLIELWVERPGDVADVTVKYKDMVSLTNTTARASVRLGARPRPRDPAQQAVLTNVQGFEFAQALREAGALVDAGQLATARAQLDAAPTPGPGDRAVVAAFRALMGDRARRPNLSRALALAARRRISPTPGVLVASR